MKLKLKESIRVAGSQHRPPSVIDTEELGISEAEAEVLVRRGSAELANEDEPVEQPEEGGPEVIRTSDDEPVEQPSAPAKSGKKK